MPSFFIDRPIFAWVVALFICLIGAISIPLLAVAQYPIIAPPSISISTSYPGASPENLYNSVTRLIEEELNGASGILNFESTSDSLGQVEITANFVPGTETGAASVEVGRREPRGPRRVIGYRNLKLIYGGHEGSSFVPGRALYPAPRAGAASARVWERRASQ